VDRALHHAIVSDGMTEATAALRASEARFRVLFDAVPVGILLIDAVDCSLLAFNAAAHEGLGYERDEFAALALVDLDLVNSRDELITLFRAIPPGGTTRLETRHRDRDGRPRDRMVTLRPIDLEGQSHILAVCTDATEKKRAEDERRDLLRRLYRAGDEVRRQIARDLHDGVGQDLTGLLLGLSALEDAIPEKTEREALLELVDLAASIGQKLQRIARAQQPTALEDFGLLRALQSQTADFAERSGLKLDLHTIGLGTSRLSPDVESTAYRIVQALLVDLTGNARARSASVVLERRSDSLQIIIEHDGISDKPGDGAPHGAQDPQDTKERLAFLGGTLAVESGCGLGTTIYVRIPLAGVAAPSWA
jgi:PAS domain S-box-containing protein